MRFTLAIKIGIVFSALGFALLLTMPSRAMALDYFDYQKMQISPIPCKGPIGEDFTEPKVPSYEYGGGGAAGGYCPNDFQTFYRDGTMRLWHPASQVTPYNSVKRDYNPPSNNPTQADNFPESCARSYAQFQENPKHRHYWVEDPEITALGKANERAREFIYWTMTHSPVIESPVLREVWSLSRNIALSFVVVVAAALSIMLMIRQRTRLVNNNIAVMPIAIKIGLNLLYIVLSASVVLLLIQLSEILMKFFIEQLTGNNLFNTYFGTQSSEGNYVGFIGCRDLNIRVSEAANTEMFMLKLTNITYYVLGVMILLRQVLLWFMLFVSPFLSILLSFPLIRNTAIIWIGVFFQWLLYGPLLALFLGAMGKIWERGIPYVFDFSRINDSIGYIYPTAIIITYGGPAQVNNGSINPFNNANYVDTFVEYVLAIIMLWAVIFFPWWLLRIFRDYCCDGIIAMKNILLSMNDTLRQPPEGPKPPPIAPARTTLTSQPLTTKTEVKVSVPESVRAEVNLSNMAAVRQASTADISRTLAISATSLRDVAKLETNTKEKTKVKENISYLQNPMSAQSAEKRQEYLNVRNELFTRSSTKHDELASRILSSTSSSLQEVNLRKETLLNSMSDIRSKVMTDVPLAATAQAAQISAMVMQTIIANERVVQRIATNTRVAVPQVKAVLQNYATNLTSPATRIVDTIAMKTNDTRESVRKVLEETRVILMQAQVAKVKSPDKLAAGKAQTLVSETAPGKVEADKAAVKETAQQKQMTNAVIDTLEAAAAPETRVDEAIPLPADQPLDEYEEIRELWVKQYEDGDVPLSETVNSRLEWVEQDVIVMTNVLNKLLSADEKLRQEALDSVGFILPIFILNNLSGAQLITYLKAKLSAAKQVKRGLEKEELKKQAENASEEELVDVERLVGPAEENIHHLEEEEPESSEEKKDTVGAAPAPNTTPASSTPLPTEPVAKLQEPTENQ